MMTSPPNEQRAHRVRFETAARYYTALLDLDLFGEWVLIRAWGGKENRLGQLRTDVCSSYEDGLARIEQVRQRRVKRGYKEIA